GVELAIRALFEAPSVAQLAKRLAAAEGGPVRPTLRPMPRPDVIPLSFAQQRLWFLDRLEGPRPTYNIPLALRLEGPLDEVALAAALGDLVGRHESLRTLLVEEDGLPRQLILEPEAAPLDFTMAETTETELARTLAAAAAEPFALAEALPLKARLSRLATDSHVLLLLLHHSAGDGWSLVPLMRDLGKAYAARQRGTAPAWTPLPVHYADYTLWQHDLLGEESDPDSRIAGQLTYWRQALAGLPDEIALPTDRPRPPAQSGRGGSIDFSLEAALHRKLTGLAREAGASLFMVLQAGLATLLTRLGAGDDIPLGSPIAGRSEAALDDLVGFFVNTLVLRIDTAGNPSFSELVGRVCEADLAAYQHQELPFERLVEALNPARALARHPLFQVMLVLQNNVAPDIALPGLDVTPEPVTINTTKFDLTFSLEEQRGADGTPAGLAGTIEYASDLYDAATVERLAERLVRLLEVVAADPARPIGSIDLLDPAE
ncbi:MAG: non-ribosomal peptide synthetase, partial [Mesorhizobium sp.]